MDISYQILCPIVLVTYRFKTVLQNIHYPKTIALTPAHWFLQLAWFKTKSKQNTSACYFFTFEMTKCLRGSVDVISYTYMLCNNVSIRRLFQQIPYVFIHSFQ